MASWEKFSRIVAEAKASKKLDPVGHEDDDVDWPYILQKTYLHACLKKRRDMVDWLGSLFEQMDPINRIAYRHTLNYGKVLINR